MKKKRIAWFANNTEDSLSFYTSSKLIPLLENDFEIDWVFEDRSVEIADLYFYQIEQIPENDFIKAHAIKTPGILLYHHFLDPEKNLSFDSELANAATAALFTQERTAEEFKRMTALRTKTAYLPYPVSLSESKSIAKGKVKKICFCGGPEREWRAEKVLAALSQTKENFVFYWLIEKVKKKSAEKIVADFRALDIRLLANKSPKAWANLVADADLAIHTLYSAFYDHGVYLPISLASAVPCIVTNFGAAEYLPDNISFKVSAGASEVSEIKAAAIRLFNNADYETRTVQVNYAADVHNPRSVAAELKKFWQ